MRRAERLFRLVNDLRTRHVTRAEDLAARFEVSARTIYRDIAHLQASGLPIDGEPGVGYLLRPGFDLPAVTFTYDQLDALAVGLALVENRGDPVLAAAALEARAKLQASLPQPQARKLADAPFFALPESADAAPPNPTHIGLLRHAIRERCVACLAYTDGTAQPTRRLVHPLALWALPEGWMFTAWCQTRQAFRTFRLDRITDLGLTGEAFADDPAKGLRAFMAQDHCAPPAAMAAKG